MLCVHLLLICPCVCVCACAPWRTCGSQRTTSESALYFRHVGSEAWAQGIDPVASGWATSPAQRLFFQTIFLCDAGWPQAHYMVDTVYELLIFVPRPPTCWDYTLVLWWPAEASYFWRIFFSFDTTQLSRHLGYRMILQCSVLWVCTLVISDILHVFMGAIFKNPFY